MINHGILYVVLETNDATTNVVAVFSNKDRALRLTEQNAQYRIGESHLNDIED